MWIIYVAFGVINAFWVVCFFLRFSGPHNCMMTGNIYAFVKSLEPMNLAPSGMLKILKTNKTLLEVETWKHVAAGILCLSRNREGGLSRTLLWIVKWICSYQNISCTKCSMEKLDTWIWSTIISENYGSSLLIFP